MKKLVSLLLFLGTFAWSTAQDFAQNKYESLLEEALLLPSENLSAKTYFKVTREATLDTWVTNMQEEVAKYTFVPTTEHESDETYKVIFGTEKSNVVAHYKGSGELLATYETYYLQSVPSHFKKVIEQKFGTVEIQHCTYKVTYKKNGEPFKRFLIQINSEGKTQNVRLDINGEPL